MVPTAEVSKTCDQTYTKAKVDVRGMVKFVPPGVSVTFLIRLPLLKHFSATNFRLYKEMLLERTHTNEYKR